MLERQIRFSSIDGVELEGTLTTPAGGEFTRVAVLTPGIEVDREEEGFYTLLAVRLASAGIASFRFEWRCHGHDGDRPLSQLSLAGLYNDIGAAVRTALGSVNRLCPIDVVAQSFSGGMAANWVRRNPDAVSRLVLLAPILDYVHEYIVRADLGNHRALTASAKNQLHEEGLVTSWGKGFSQQIVNEFYSAEIAFPSEGTFVIHGGSDSGVDIEIPARFVSEHPTARLLVVKGADHGFCEPGDDDLTSSASRAFYEQVFQEIVMILLEGHFVSSGEDTTL
jgi:uncharacterized protein